MKKEIGIEKGKTILRLTSQGERKTTDEIVEYHTIPAAVMVTAHCQETKVLMLRHPIPPC